MVGELVSRHLGVGDVFPQVQLRTACGRQKVPAQFAGRPLLLHLCALQAPAPLLQRGAEGSLLSAIVGRRCELSALGVGTLVVSRGEGGVLPVLPNDIGDTECLVDPTDGIATAFGYGHNEATLLLNENQRVMAVLTPREFAGDGNRILARIRSLLPKHGFEEAKIHAPVLRVPGVFDPAFCKHLIEVFEDSPHAPSGFNQQGKDGAPLIFDDKVKKRRDFVVRPQTPLAEQIRVLYMRRLIPEIAKAFYFEVKSHEAFKVARYDAEDSGFFNRHRDNTNSANAHRRFAVSINLNAEGHEGGHLVFPEYGEAGYRPDSGEALVFCCSLLHEARPVTRGRRYVQLAFLY